MNKPSIKISEGPLISKIAQGIFIGNACSSQGGATFEKNHINAVVTLLDYGIVKWQLSPFTDHIKKDRRLMILCWDSKTQDLLIHMKEICDFMDQMLLPLPAVQSSPQRPGKDVISVQQ